MIRNNTALRNQLIETYPALIDTDQYGALLIIANKYLAWDDPDNPNTFDGLLGRLRLSAWGIEDANELCELELEHTDEMEKLAYQFHKQRQRALKDFGREIADMEDQMHYEVACMGNGLLRQALGDESGTDD